MRVAIVPLALLFSFNGRSEAGELSLRGSVGTGFVLEYQEWGRLNGPSPGAGLSGSVIWSPAGSGPLLPIVGLGFWRSMGEVHCVFECGEFRIATTALPLAVGARLHLGDPNRRRRSLHIEVSPALVYVNQSVRQQGDTWGEEFRGTEEHWLAGGILNTVVPIALGERVTLEVGAGYLWTEALGKPAGDGLFSQDLEGFDELSFVFGLALR